MKPVYFDLSVIDVSTARQFLEQAFGWKFDYCAMPYEYYRIEAGPPEEAGIDGSIGQIVGSITQASCQNVRLALPVSSLKEMSRKIETCGGSIEGKAFKIPRVGKFLTCSGPGGLVFDLFEADEVVK
ncbi:MAG: hypothetical protein WBO17_06075 [Sphingorhabdus sp.]